MKIKTFITLGFIGFAIVALIVGSVALINLNRINSSVKALSEDKIIKCQITERILKYIFQANLYTRDYLITHGEENIKVINTCITNTTAETHKLSIEEDNVLLQLNGFLSEYEDIFKEVVEQHKKLQELIMVIRLRARQIEETISQMDNPNLLISFLQLRRQEKNLMLYGQKESKFSDSIDKLYALIDNNSVLSTKVKDYNVLMEQFVTITNAIESIVNKMLDKDNQIRFVTEEINKRSWEDNKNMGTKVTHLINAARYGHITIIFLIIAATGFGLFLSNYISKLLYIPIGNLADAMKKAQYGDLTARADVFREDEVGNLAKGFNLMMGDIEKSNKEIKALQAQLIQSEKLACLGEIAAGIAHEINNPLGGILIYSNLLLEDMNEADPDRENLRKIINETIRCKDIVKELLDFARQTEPKMEAEDINKYIRGAIDLVEKQAIHHNIEIRTDLSGNLPEIKCDAAQLQQVFLNILINAVEAMQDKKSGKLVIESRLSDSRSYIEIIFRDTGSGIPREILDKIYNPFFTTKPPGKGTGLGLSVSYGIIKKHDGIIEVESEEGKGTTFTIKLRKDYEEC
ncbi:MAG: ATP-binding protein [bacterium]